MGHRDYGDPPQNLFSPFSCKLCSADIKPNATYCARCKGAVCPRCKKEWQDAEWHETPESHCWTCDFRAHQEKSAREWAAVRSFMGWATFIAGVALFALIQYCSAH